jgi:molybdenum cofactor cytidylyltransferase
MPDRVHVAVLAAGASRRLGQPKQLVTIDGETLLRRACRIAIAADVGPVTAIVGSQAQACAQAIHDLSVSVHVNTEWAQGLASSIRTAAKFALDENAAGLMLLQSDQYRLSVTDLNALLSAWLNGAGLVAVRARFESYLGPPAIFPAACFHPLLELRGDRGARQIFNSLPPERIMTVRMPSAVFDLDTPAQLENLSNHPTPYM